VTHSYFHFLSTPLQLCCLALLRLIDGGIDRLIQDPKRLIKGSK
jgi:hypothetical protein